ncbi:NAD(P)-dependent alcohol dehydrogenase [Sphingobium sp. CAP-1]|uniref:NAD(P)-dependent alcohol dehydrogenase n=1 Tax=Sphingobium sp. CAP-1 TaxID=2676077 RepID=UPI0012BB1FCB|nr:NAD(P)-dependent alcohol dehydrogenase [Sphingobium sp. CAP-1]QGP81206.1 alcohol dehydrogenase catalytic domain-containing protein [Sphingobium sp. CAP-1]
MARIAIKAAVVERPGAPFQIERLEIDPPGPGQVLVRIRACGICHTDMVMRDGALPIPFPVVLGHEGAGIVEAVGSGVRHVGPGDAVLLSFHSCGVCPACHVHQPGYCSDFVPRNFLGIRQPGEGGLWRGGAPVGGNIFGQSAFASHALAHRDNVVKVDADLPLELLAPLGCGIQTGAGTVLETLRVAPGESIAILGAGAVGLSALMAAVIAGAGRIAVIDRHPHRLDLARELGATQAAGDLADLDGLFDYIVDTTGVLALLGPAVARLAQRGTLALVAAYPPGTGVLDAAAVMSMGRRIVGVVEGGVDPQRFIPRLIGYYREGRLPVDRLVRCYDFADVEAAFGLSQDGYVVKAVLCL